MKTKLTKYQKDIMNKIRNSNHKVVMELPLGFGKGKKTTK